ncbi:sensor histidine kinase [Planctobacterium marinum]|uniref:sensor histidine kinase n=1 Tax=Planctobacterium marinum TaxID=1631968 RepID=UPI001E2F783D|nr:histidine kinase [Planctobacterium marinum]MCC2607844.1 histidine kinase [Planctobacterium marinum]
MYRRFLSHIPGRAFFLTNTLVWLGVNSIASWLSYSRQLNAGQEASYLHTWLEFIPWWGNFIWFAPVVAACVAMMPERQNKRWLSVVDNILLFFATMPMYWVMSVLTATLMRFGNLHWESIAQLLPILLTGPFYFDIIVYVSVVCIAYTRKYEARAADEQKRNRELAHLLLQTELDALKAQLNPHFLFNTLNSIASLIRLQDKAKALLALSELSQMLRKVLEHQNNEMTPLSQEVEFIKSYLTIQQMRFVNKLQVELEVADECLQYDVPFMLLQPLVENAVQHGSQLESDENLIQLSITQQGDELLVRLRNKFIPDSPHKGFGIGIENSRKRLSRIYGDEFLLQLRQCRDGYFETLVRLPTGE